MEEKIIRHLDKLSKIRVEENISKFMEGEGKDKGRNPDERYASFDYCFNYFQSFREKNKIKELVSDKYLQQSCLQLGFFLASWGMFRNRFLLEKSIRSYVNLIGEIARFNKRIWDIDVDSYTDENIDLLIEFKEKICKFFKEIKMNCSDTLFTKIMLGIFGNIPAFDSNFCAGFEFKCCGGDELKILAEFYKKEENKKIIDNYSKTIYTYDFLLGQNTKRNYTKAKIIDMVGFIEGQKSIKINKIMGERLTLI